MCACLCESVHAFSVGGWGGVGGAHNEQVIVHKMCLCACMCVLFIYLFIFWGGVRGGLIIQMKL